MVQRAGIDGSGVIGARRANKPPIGKNRRNLWRRVRVSLPYYTLILLPAALLLIFKYYPMYGLQIAFKDYRVTRGFAGSPWVGLKHFTQFLTASSAWNVIRNTLMISAYSLLLGFPAPIILAICLNESPSRKLRKPVQMITYMPYFISTVVLVSMIIQFTDVSGGLVNQMIRGVSGAPINFMGEKRYFRMIYTLTGIWQGAGYSAVIYLAALSGVSPELYDAATVDGAGKFRRILNVDLPSITPTIRILFILNTGGVLTVAFEKIFLMQNSINLSVSEVLSTYVYKIGLQGANFSFSTAADMFKSVIGFAILAAANAACRMISDDGLF
ncbi:MAG: ABC transporter permease subunit [Oscillospiraceae bacterium]|jgi:putative aldouronate transport system permease protein|nr:ABC transporter permease subunit [Oscillospiraceae bacterium]